MPGKIKNYTEDFKKQIIALKKSGKSINELHKEYNIAKSTICKWTADYNNSGSFKAVDNRTAEENEMIRLKKELAQLQMENDILKQAALIMARK